MRGEGAGVSQAYPSEQAGAIDVNGDHQRRRVDANCMFFNVVSSSVERHAADVLLLQ